MNMFLEAAAQDPGRFGTGIGWLEELLQAVINVVNPILIIVAIAGIVYAIVVGIKFVKAEDKTQREEAKQKLIYVIIGIVVTFVLIALFYWLAYNLSSILKYTGFVEDASAGAGTGTGGTGTGGGATT